jgi:hypothetical protein
MIKKVIAKTFGMLKTIFIMRVVAIALKYDNPMQLYNNQLGGNEIYKINKLIMKYLSPLKWVILMCFPFFISSCIEDIAFKTNTGEGILTVDGGFTDLDEPQTLVLKKTATYGFAPEPVLGAKVSVYSLDGKSGVFVEKGKGKYVLDPKILRGVSGQSYRVDITLANGQTYQSEPEVMPARVTPDSIFWSFGYENTSSSNTVDNKTEVVNVYVSTPFKANNKDAFLRWQTASDFRFQTLSSCNPFGTTTTCYYSEVSQISSIPLISSRDLGLDRTNKTRVDYKPIAPGYPFLEKYYFSLYQYAISAKAYDYWQKINIVNNQNGSIFDRAPAAVKGNVFNKNNPKEQVLGYFEVASVAIKRTFVTGGEVKAFYPIRSKEGYCRDLEFVVNNRYYTGCCDCLSINQPNATLQQPAWWK